MSENLGKKIKLIAGALGVLGTIAFAALTYCEFAADRAVAGLCFLLLAVLSLASVFPGIMIGKLVEENAALREESRMQSEMIARLSKENEKRNPADKYSPSNRIRGQMSTGTVTTGFATTGARTRVTNVPPVTTGTTETVSMAKDFTREFSASTETIPAQTATTGSMTRTILTDAFPELPKKNVTSELPYATTGAVSVPSSRSSFPVQPTISAGGLHSVCVRRDGTVTAVGYGTYGQCDVDSWSNIIGVSAGNHHTVGLRANGTCIAAGYSGYGQCDIDNWSSISMVSAG
ncbi:MAG: hypothetical protein KBS76_03900, partial [Ruminococcus sp.]|nr:hypothetical protein [Candidatus Apopatosoma intestinale]